MLTFYEWPCWAEFHNFKRLVPLFTALSRERFELRLVFTLFSRSNSALKMIERSNFVKHSRKDYVFGVRDLNVLSSCLTILKNSNSTRLYQEEIWKPALPQFNTGSILKSVMHTHWQIEPYPFVLSCFIQTLHMFRYLHKTQARKHRIFVRRQLY